MKEKYKEFWKNNTASENAEYLGVAPKIASPWKKLKNIDHKEYGETRVDSYTDNEIAEIIFADEYNKTYRWEVTHPWLDEIGPEASGEEDDIIAARKACDGAIKKMGWIILEKYIPQLDFDIFDGNSSTRDALCDFAESDMSLLKLRKDCWPRNCKKYIKDVFIPMGEKEVRKQVKNWAKKNGY